MSAHPLSDHVHEHVVEYRITEYRDPSGIAVAPGAYERLVLELTSLPDGQGRDYSPLTCWGLPVVTLAERRADMASCTCTLPE